MRFALPQNLRDAVLLVVMQFGLLDLLGFGFELFAVRVISKVNNAENRNDCGKSIKTVARHEFGGNSGCRCAREISDRHPQKIVFPNLPKRFAGFERLAQRRDACIRGVMHRSQNADRRNVISR